MALKKDKCNPLENVPGLKHYSKTTRPISVKFETQIDWIINWILDIYDESFFLMLKFIF